MFLHHLGPVTDPIFLPMKEKAKNVLITWSKWYRGAGLTNFLLSAAVTSAPAKEKIPDVSLKSMNGTLDTRCTCLRQHRRNRRLLAKRSLKHSVGTMSLSSPTYQRVIKPLSELFSPVVRFESVRLILALSTLEDYYCVSVDVRDAYPHGKLDEEIYMRQPEGFKARGQENKVIYLQCALHGLKQAGLAWWKELNSSMNELGFKCLLSVAGLFVCKDLKEIIIAIVYVNDAMFFGKNKAQVNFKKKLFMDKWECCDLGEVKGFLHMCITRKDIYLDQCDYLDKVLEHYSMTNAKSGPTLLPSNSVPQLAKA
jgi:Reverse transcriptase (RNA-dependent DNA polymerase)